VEEGSQRVDFGDGVDVDDVVGMKIDLAHDIAFYCHHLFAAAAAADHRVNLRMMPNFL
jgi:hypothetical protein